MILIYNPRLLWSLMVGAAACVVWAIVLFAREAKEFGWGQVIISVISLIVVQIIVFFVFR